MIAPDIEDHNARAERERRRRGRITRLTVVLVILAVPLALFHRFLFLGNFQVVESGRLYRGAQPKGNLDSLITTHGLATVLNLRGGTLNDWWYAEEVETCRAHGVDFYDLPMGASRRPSRHELLLLIDLFQQGDYPLLIHCKSGSDRTGLAAAVYALTVRGEPPAQARDGFSIWSGHVPLFGPERLHDPLNEYAGYLNASALPHNPARFRRWVERHYRSDDPDDDDTLPALRPGPRPRAALAGTLPARR